MRRDSEEVTFLTTQLEEAEKREGILSSHFSQRSDYFNKFEEKIGQHEEEVNFLNVLEAAKRAEEAMKIQLTKNEEDYESLEEEIVSLRDEVD